MDKIKCCDVFENFGADEGKARTMRWQYRTTCLLGCKREFVLPEVAVWGLHPEEEEGQGGLRGQENWGRRYVSRQCHVAARLGVSGSESSKGQQQWGFCSHGVYLMCGQ